jgi:membrane protease YdiL (CAAX protease family)
MRNSVMTTLLSPNNRLFVLAEDGARQSSALAAVAVVLLLILLMIATQVLVRILLRPIFPGDVESVADPIAEIVGFISIYLGLWVCLRFLDGRPLWTLGFGSQGALRRVLGGAFVGGLMVAATAGLVVISGASFAPGAWQTTGVAAFGIGLFLLLVSAVQSSAEEALFRGWLLQVVGSRCRPWIGVLVSSLLFSLAHALGTNFAPLPSLNLFLFGLFAAVLALGEGGLWGASAWHAAWNWTQGRLLGFPVSGGAADQGLVISMRATGSELITGGAFGPDGGLAATAVLLVGIGIVVMRSRRNAARPHIQMPANQRDR